MKFKAAVFVIKFILRLLPIKKLNYNAYRQQQGDGRISSS